MCNKSTVDRAVTLYSVETDTNQISFLCLKFGDVTCRDIRGRVKK